MFNKVIEKIASDLNIATEVVATLSKEPIVTIFGSARTPADHKFYIDTKEIAARLAQKGFTICTGGGPGLMRAGSEGAKSVGGKTLGLSIKLPHEQKQNEFLDKNITFQNFSQRKIVFSAVSNAYVVVPGGYGSLDELFEVLTLMQCGFIPKAPVVLYDIAYWTPLVEFIVNSLVPEGMIRKEDASMFYMAATVEEAVDYITHNLSNKEAVPTDLVV
jgi:uncharacterized protein (TIGR00730 family)